MLTALLVGVLGCGDEGPAADPYQCMAGGGAACFELPTDVIRAADADGVAVLPVLDCGPYEDLDGTVAFTGQTIDLITKAPVGDVRVEGFGDLSMTARLFDVTSDDAGDYTVTAAQTSVSHRRTTRAGSLPVHMLYQRTNVAVPQQSLDLETTTHAQMQSLLQTVGDRFLLSRTQLLATAFDCAGNHLINVIANIGPATARNGSRLFETGVRVYYGREDGTLRRRTELMQTTGGGTLAITNISVGTHFVQLWGYPTEQDLAVGSPALKLLGEVQIYVPDVDAAILLPLHGRL